MLERSAPPALSQRRQAILDYIRKFIADHHYAPTYREIGAGVGIGTTSVVKYHLDALVQYGYIGRAEAVPRGLWLIERTGTPVSSHFFGGQT
jgi:repressor LexA